MIRRLVCAVALAMAMTGSAMAIGHDSGSAPDRGPVSALQHQLADLTGWDWLHPALPVPTHGEHVAWEQVRGDVLAAATLYQHDARIATMAGNVNYFAAYYRADPSMDAQHRLDEATAALAQMLAWTGRGNAQVEAMLHMVDAHLLMSTDVLCGSEGILAREAHVDGPDHFRTFNERLKRTPVDTMLFAFVMAGLLAVGMFSRLRRRA